MQIKMLDGSTVDLPKDRILANNVIAPGSYNPHDVRLWVIGHAHGATCAVWASHEDDALDEAADAGLLDAMMIDERDADEDTAYLGNAGEPFDLSYAWVREARPLEEQSAAFAFAMGYAQGAGLDTLDD